jgi:epoxide hydrolase
MTATTATATTGIEPFRLEVPDGDLKDLQDRLHRTRWPQEPPGTAWESGTPTDEVRMLADYWADGYDWRHHEARLNKLPQFTTTIDGQTVHFLHVRSPEPDALPLVLTHGWPSSFVEYLDVIGPLTDPRSHGGDAADAFHLVVPSIPGFTFSMPLAAGWGSRRIGQAWGELMNRLGYERFGAVGNDAGSLIAPQVAGSHPDQVVGVHVTQVFSFPSGDPAEFESLTEEDHRRLGLMQRFMDEHSGFNRIQSTRPQTLAFGPTDSPVAQLAWNLDLLRGFGEQSDDVKVSLDADWILTNVMLYWLTNTSGTSARLYYEDTHDDTEPEGPTTFPLGVAVFPGDFQSIRPFAERDHAGLPHWTEFDRGGHFAGTDAPDLLTADLREFFRQLR